MPPATTLIPKIRLLTSSETQTSFDNWRESIIFQISLDAKSARFLTDLKSWDNSAQRGFANDPGSVGDDTRMTAAAKEALLNIVLGSISSNAPVISPRFIKTSAKSI